VFSGDDLKENAGLHTSAKRKCANPNLKYQIGDLKFEIRPAWMGSPRVPHPSRTL
jgi:hypothetical protein